MQSFIHKKIFYFFGLLLIFNTQLARGSDCPSKDDKNYFFEETYKEYFASFKGEDFIKCGDSWIERIQKRRFNCGGRQYSGPLGDIILSKNGDWVVASKDSEGISKRVMRKPISCTALDGFKLVDKGIIIRENDYYWEIIGPNIFWTYRIRYLTPYERIIPKF